MLIGICLLSLARTCAYGFEWCFGYWANPNVTIPCSYSPPDGLVPPPSEGMSVKSGTDVYWVFLAKGGMCFWGHDHWCWTPVETNFPNVSKTGNDCYRGSFHESGSGGTVTEYDHYAYGPCPLDDPPQTAENVSHIITTITWVGVDHVEGPTEVCAGSLATFYGVPDPSSGPAGWMCWSTTDDDGGTISCSDYGVSSTWQYATSGCPSGGYFTHTWSKPGSHTVTFKCGDSTETLDVEVLAWPPDPETGMSCGDSGGSGGCGSGTCGASSSQLPFPGIRTSGMDVRLPSDPGGFDPNGGDGGSANCSSCDMNLGIECCGNECYLVYTQGGTPGMIPGGFGQANLPNGGYMTQNGANPDGVPNIQVTNAAGKVTNYTVPPAGGARPIAWSAGYVATSTQDSSGRTTTFSRDENFALQSAVLPNGDTWTYTHDTGDRKIKQIIAPDEVTSEMTYVQSGPAAGKIASIYTYDAPSTPRTQLAAADYTYDDQGRLQSATKSSLKVTYDYVGNTIVVTEQSADTLGTVFSQTVYDYGDAMSNTTTVTRKHPTDSSKDEVTVYTYYTKLVSGARRKTYLRSVTDPMENTTTYSRYVGEGTDIAGMTVDEDYKFADAVYQYGQNDGSLGKVFKVTDALDQETTYDYDYQGNVTLVTYPGAFTEEYTYYTYGARALHMVKNVRGIYTLYERGGVRFDQVTDVKVSGPIDGLAPDEYQWDDIPAIRQYAYYASGLQKDLLQTETVPGIDGTTAKVTEYSYLQTVGGVDKLQAGPTATAYQYWNGSSYDTKTSATAYGVMGRVDSTTDAANRAIAYTYDKLGRQLTTTYATGRVTQSYYNCCSLLWTKDEDGRYTHYAYDAASRVTDTWIDNTQGETLSGDPLVHYTYDAFGNVQTVTTYSETGVGRTTTYAYDKNNRVIAIDHPGDLGDERFQYDELGNLTAKQDGNGDITAYEYDDDLHRLIAVKYDIGGTWGQTISYPLSSPDVTYSYYEGSRLRHEMTDSVGTSHYEYDIQDKLISYAPPLPSGREITYEYNNLGQKRSTSTTGLGTVHYNYFANGWLRNVQLGTNTPPVASYTYDAVGNRTNVALGNGTSTAYAYDSDPRYRIDTITHNVTGTPSAYTISYASRDGAGNPLSMEDWNPEIEYTYDNNSRLTGAGTDDFNYDWVGNRVNPPASPNPMVYNAADQLTSWPGRHTYDYLGTGSLYHQYDSTGQTVQETYTYTAANLLESVVHAGIGTSSMTWDPDSNRIAFTSSEDSGMTKFVYDTTAGIPAVIEEVLPSTSSVYYVREPNGALIARIAGENTSYYHFDALGSTKLLTDSAGTVTDTFTYDAWGSLTNRTGTTPQPYQYVGQLGYYTDYQDTNLSLLQLGVRFYDPALGSFTQVDPIAEDIHLYTYVGDRPTYRTDPSGREIHTEESCQADRTKCENDAWATFNSCLLDTVAPGGAYDVSVCMVGCLPTLVWGKKAYKICLEVCAVVAGGAVCIDAESCGKVLHEQLDSCEVAYNRCIMKMKKQKAREQR